MAVSTLTLSIDKGPKKGETLVCKPGTEIRVGRVVAGNTLTIKDSSISQKHLSVIFVPETNRWVVTDHGSSNGTYVNGSLISPEEPFSLNDGDKIKIGEKTTISVNIAVPVVESVVLPRRGRFSRLPRPVNFTGEEFQEKVGEPVENGLRQRTRGRKGGGSNRVSKNDDALESVLVQQRVKRASYRDCSTMGSVKKLKVEEEVEIISNSDFRRVEGKEKLLKENNAVLEEEVQPVLRENNSSVNEMEDDMNNMTLGEWFDRMEDYLPKAINKVAEEITAKLREKARLFDEYYSQNSDALVE